MGNDGSRSPATWQTSSELEQALVKTFNLKAARVLVRDHLSYAEMVSGLGALAARFFDGVIDDQSVIGVSWGSAIGAMIRELPPRNLPNVEVVQLIGATGAERSPTDGPMLAQMLTERLGSRCWYLHAPLVVESEAGRDALLKERGIRETLARAEQATVALVGIGSTDPELYSLLRTGYVDRAELERIRAAGAIGDVCAQHYDKNGKWLNIDINRRVIGVNLHTLSRIDTVIGIAGGERKAETIHAALKGQYVNVLITDEQAAEAVLALHKGIHPAKAVARESAGPTLVSLKGIWKVFDGTPVLWGIDLDLQTGEIHALLGGNGSGKSTTMKILSGVYTPDAGTIELNGHPTTVDNPASAHEQGIYMVPQEPHIFPDLSVEENLLMGTNLDPHEARQRIQILAREIGFDSPLSTPAGALSIANQQLLEIIRGLIRNANILILDEPTSALTFREVENLFERMRTLAARGIGMFFISHRLNEVLEISDRISVLRDGVFVLNAPTSTVTSRDLVRAMLPESARAEVAAGPQRVERKPHKPGEPVLEVHRLSGEAFHDVSLQVRAGEVVGLAGLVGAGRSELAEAIVGIDQHVHGEVRINGTPVDKRSPRRCQSLGLVYVPEDRHRNGIFLDLPNVETTTASILPRLGRFLISSKKEEAVGRKYVDQLAIKVSSLWQPAKTLSGGNQQKVVLSKALASEPRVIILDEPTRGVDARARQDVYHLIHELTAQGVGVLLISSELEEVIELSDRVLVMYQGTVVEELAHSECELERVMAASFGLEGEPQS